MAASSEDLAPANDTKEEVEQVVTPYEVTGGADGKVDYDRLVTQFGVTPIQPDLVTRIEKATGVKAHPFLRRGIFFAHRDLEYIVDLYERKKPFYLYTGRGPSSEALHLGHLIPFMFTRWLQEAFQVPLVIQLTDDEKVLWKDLTIEEAKRLARENCKDIIACGFDIQKTFIFSDYKYIGGPFYDNIQRIAGAVTASQAASAFGLQPGDSIGKWGFSAVQAAPSFSDSFPHIFGARTDVPCLIPCAIDQDPYFRITRDAAPRLKRLKPALIESTFFPALRGDTGKMSASIPSSSIFVSDSAKSIKDKINKYAFSGGRQTVEEHRRLGANVDVDISCKYLSFFMDDDERLEEIKTAYGKGELLTGEVKAELITVLTNMVGRHQRMRAQVTEDIVDVFMTARPIKCPNL